MFVVCFPHLYILFSFGVLPPSARCGSILPQARGFFIPLFRLAMYQYHRIPMLILFGVFVSEFFCTCLIFLFLFSFPFFCVFRFCLSMCLGCCQMCRADPLKRSFFWRVVAHRLLSCVCCAYRIQYDGTAMHCGRVIAHRFVCSLYCLTL